ncbi:MAG: L,D-transpeptidase [Gammaproteobacteria bacterium]|nr:L,D-transpeptidase [Gammaproteobacteria bacterium]
MTKIRLSIILAVSSLMLYAPTSFPDEIIYEYNESGGYGYPEDNDINNAFVEPAQMDDEQGDYLEENDQVERNNHHVEQHYATQYDARLPEKILDQGEKTIVIDPRVHAWGAYNSRGILLRAGLASAGSKWCEDLGRPCRTKVGVFRINSLGKQDCVSSRYPLDVGGAPMPYCMYFNGSQALHGSNEVRDANISHGCVRVSIQDAEWLRYDFAEVGTKVIIKSY